MSLVNYTTKEINLKIVYYGPGLGGKTTNLKFIYSKVGEKTKGKLLTLATELDRTLFFDFLPFDVGEIKGFRLRLHLYTVPGQVFYNASRRIILRGADGVIFVADSQKERREDNIDSFKNLADNLTHFNKNLDDIPYVLQYNKRDLPNIMSVDEMQSILNPENKIPYFEAVAIKGIGVFETLKKLVAMVINTIS